MPNTGDQGATFTVVANDAEISWQHGGSYYCDGTADDVQIQAAIDALPAGGGRVLLSEGTFTLAASITDGDQDNVTLEGQGPSTIITVGTDAGFILLDFSDTRNPKTGWTFRDFKIDGNKANQGGTSIDVHHCFSGNHLQHTRFENVHIVNSYAEGIRSAGTVDDLIITNCYLSASTDANIHCTGGAGKNIVISHNYIGEAASDGNVRMRSGCSYILLEGNVIVQSAAGVLGLLSDSTTGTAVGRGIIGNTFLMTGNDAAAIHLNTANNLNNIVKGNVISGADEGILVGTAVVGAIIEGNNITTCTNGMKVVGSKHIINGNHIDTCDTGLWIQGDYCTIIGNLVKNSQVNHGLHLDTATYCTVTGNQFFDDQGSKTQVNGIVEANSADFNIITNNNVFDNKTNTIKAVGLGADTIVRGNVGFATEASGTSTLVNGQTEIAVTHGLAITPVIGDVMVTPIESWGNATKFWISAYSSTTFTITVDQDPGADVDFAWKAVLL